MRYSIWAIGFALFINLLCLNVVKLTFISDGFDLYKYERRKQKLSLPELRTGYDSLSDEEKENYEKRANYKLYDHAHELRVCCYITTVVLAIGLIMYMCNI